MRGHFFVNVLELKQPLYYVNSLLTSVLPSDFQRHDYSNPTGHTTRCVWEHGNENTHNKLYLGDGKHRAFVCRIYVVRKHIHNITMLDHVHTWYMSTCLKKQKIDEYESHKHIVDKIFNCHKELFKLFS